MNAIELCGIRVVYAQPGAEPRVALDDFSLAADDELLALLGPNGSGKSTLMSVIARRIIPARGTLVAPGSRKSLAVVFQTPALDGLLTVRENLIVAGALHGLDKATTRNRILALAPELGIADRLDDQVRRLSGGLARRADLARALVSHPRVLLLDEPTSGLDIDARRTFWEMLARIRDRLHMTILLSTHLIDEAERADRVVMIRAGRNIRRGAPAQLKAGLGSRVIKIKSPDPIQLDRARAWLSENGITSYLIDDEVLGLDADPSLAANCPVAGASITIAPPSLEDVYRSVSHDHNPSPAGAST